MSRVNRGMRQQWEADIAKYQSALHFDPNNSSAHASLAEVYRQSGRRDEAIHEFRTAINLSPHGPHTAKWKATLREVLNTPEGYDKHDFTVCDHCHADLPSGTKTCTRCGTRLRMGFFEWLAQPEVFKDVGRQTILVTMIVVIMGAAFSSLSLEWKACVLCATVMVGARYLLKGIGE